MTSSAIGTLDEAYQQLAVEHGDEHVVKFADTAADVYARTGSPDTVAAALRAAELVSRYLTTECCRRRFRSSLGSGPD